MIAWILALSLAQVPAPPDQAPGPVAADGLGAFLAAATAEPDEAELAGLPKGTEVVTLTWERAFALAMARARPGAAPALAIDARGLDLLAREHLAGDFARFRETWLGGGFRDPSPEMLEALARRAGLGAAARRSALWEQLKQVCVQLVQGEASGITQLQLDKVQQDALDARAALTLARLRYQDALDALKETLGISLLAPLVPDAALLAPFTDVFEAADAWQADPRRKLDALSTFAARLPALGLDGARQMTEATQAIVDAAGDATPARLAAARDVRTRGRRIAETMSAYEVERRRLVLEIRQCTEAFEQIIAPPRGTAGGAASSVRQAIEGMRLVQVDDRLRATQERLVDLWVTYQRDRLDLYRTLGILPFDDLRGFVRSLTPTPDRPAAAPAEAPPPP